MYVVDNEIGGSKTKGSVLDHLSELGFSGVEAAVYVALLQEPALGTWSTWSCPTSLREVEANVNLILDENDPSLTAAPSFGPTSPSTSPSTTDEDDEEFEAETTVGEPPDTSQNDEGDGELETAE